MTQRAAEWRVTLRSEAPVARLPPEPVLSSRRVVPPHSVVHVAIDLGFFWRAGSYELR
jgi:hypothetical protein